MLRRAALLTGLLLASCDGFLLGDRDRGERTLSSTSDLPLGLVTGGIYVGGQQPLRHHADAIFCEMRSLGASWIRIEAGWWEVPVEQRREVYRNIVDRAHAHGLKVIVLVPGASCSGPTDLGRTDRFIAAYLAKLEALTELFQGHEPDAWEIVNEPNIGQDTEAAATDEPGDTGSCRGDRLHGNSYAWLLYRVAEWKQRLGRKELIIAGAPANTFVEEGWWQDFLGAGVWSDPGRPARLFDLFGIHPYNACKRDDNGLGLAAWKADLLWRLRDLKKLLDGKLGRDDTRFMVTEFGWQTLPCSGQACFQNEDQAAEGLRAAVEAFSESGVVEAALWYTYRDDPLDTQNGERFGLRREWDGERYPAKPTLWRRFAELAGGASRDPEACWSGGDGVGRWPGGKLQPEIATCHAGHGGAAAMGLPFDNGGGAAVHEWGAGVVQDFTGGSFGPALCMLRTPGAKAWVVRGAIRDAYLAGGGAGGIGYPLGDEGPRGGAPYQEFERGHVGYDFGTKSYRVYP